MDLSRFYHGSLVTAVMELGVIEFPVWCTRLDSYRPQHVSDYKKAWQKAAREAGIPDRRIYDLRASFASRANACHASGLTIAQLLGQANSTQILPTYVKLLDENTRAVIDAL